MNRSGCELYSPPLRAPSMSSPTKRASTQPTRCGCGLGYSAAWPAVAAANRCVPRLVFLSGTQRCGSKTAYTAMPAAVHWPTSLAICCSGAASSVCGDAMAGAPAAARLRTRHTLRSVSQKLIDGTFAAS
eukprot:scaffold1672_cov75-Phaeocystis_antarctica.AAC.4